MSLSIHKLDDISFFYRMRAIVHKHLDFKEKYPLAYAYSLNRLKSIEPSLKLIKSMRKVLDKLDLI